MTRWCLTPSGQAKMMRLTCLCHQESVCSVARMNWQLLRMTMHYPTSRRLTSVSSRSLTILSPLSTSQPRLLRTPVLVRRLSPCKRKYRKRTKKRTASQTPDPPFLPVPFGSSPGFPGSVRPYAHRRRLAGRRRALSFDVGAKLLQAASHVLVTAVDELQAGDYRSACGCKCGDYYGAARAYVCRVQSGCGKWPAPDDEGAFEHLDVCPCSAQVIHMGEAVSVNPVTDDAGAGQCCQVGRERCLQVSRNLGILGAGNVSSLKLATGVNQQGFLACLQHPDPGLLKLGDDGRQVLMPHALQGDGSTGCGCSQHVGARLDTVRQRAERGAPQAGDSGDGNGAGAGTSDVGAHGVKHVRQVGNFRFQGGIVYDHGAGTYCTGQQDVLCAADGGCLEIDCAVQRSVHFRVEVATFLADLHPQGLEGTDVPVNRTGSEGAAARH